MIFGEVIRLFAIRGQFCYDSSVNIFGIYIFRGSSAVERPPVKRLVVGSNPTRGAS